MWEYVSIVWLIVGVGVSLGVVSLGEVLQPYCNRASTG
jgi:hypothetical protein